jgi:hypothetical protein
MEEWMKRPNAVALIAFASALTLGGAQTARADNTACAGAIYLVPDGSAQTGTIVGTESRWYKFINKDNRSYSVSVENLTPTDEAPVAEMAEIHTGSCTGPFFPNTIPREQAEPVVRDSALAGGGDRQVIQPPSIGLPGEMFFSVQQAGGGTFRVRIDETTLYSAAWTTLGNYDTYWTVHNTINQALFGTLVLLDTGGATVLKIDLPGGPSFFTPPGATFSTNTRSLGVARNQFGGAIFFHNGPPGAYQVTALLADFTQKAPVILQSTSFQTKNQLR